MRISELSSRTDVSVATIKFYLREGLLPPGDSAGATNQATYSERHVHRLHLVRTLLQVGGLSVATARNTVHALDNPDIDRHLLLGVAHAALPRPGPDRADHPAEEVAAARREVAAFLDGLGWPDTGDSTAHATLADALVALRRLGRDVGPEVFSTYAEAADALAAREVATLDAAAPRERMVEDVIIGTVIFEAVLIALRRLAHAKYSSQRFSPIA